MGYSFYAYAPVVPLLNSSQYIGNLPVAFNSVYAERDWFGVDYCIQQCARDDIPFYLSDVVRQVESMRFQNTHNEQFLALVEMWRVFKVSELFVVPILSDERVPRAVLFASVERLCVASQRRASAVAYALHEWVKSNKKEDELIQNAWPLWMDELLSSIRDGLSVTDMAAKQNVSDATIKRRIKDVKNRFGSDHRGVIVARASKLGVLNYKKSKNKAKFD